MTVLSMIRGDDFTKTITFKQDGVAIDITGSTVFFTIRKTDKGGDGIFTDVDSDVLYKQTVTIHTAPVSGTTAISIPDTDSTLFEPEDYYYDIQYKSAIGSISTPMRDVFRVTRDTTRRIV